MGDNFERSASGIASRWCGSLVVHWYSSCGTGLYSAGLVGVIVLYEKRIAAALVCDQGLAPGVVAISGDRSDEERRDSQSEGGESVTHVCDGGVGRLGGASWRSEINGWFWKVGDGKRRDEKERLLEASSN